MKKEKNNVNAQCTCEDGCMQYACMHVKYYGLPVMFSDSIHTCQVLWTEPVIQNPLYLMIQ